MATPPVLVWYRQDLRVTDQPALAAAAASRQPVIPLYVHDEVTPGIRRPGGASRWWLHGSLAALASDLAHLGSALVLRQGAAVEVIVAMAAGLGASAVHWTAHAEPFWRDAELEMAARLAEAGIAGKAFHGSTLFPFGAIRSRRGSSYQVFTPFWRAILEEARAPERPILAPASLCAPNVAPESVDLDCLALRPSKPNWAADFSTMWQPGARRASEMLDRFLEDRLSVYENGRNHPEPIGTSRLSPHLHFGEISARQVWHRTLLRAAAVGKAQSGAEAFLRELAWREFYANCLAQHPTMGEQPMQESFRDFPWRVDTAALTAWKRGCTGYPIVDAGMRELWQTGWMHNRVRMIVASFLVKHLLQPWQLGEAWFWDTLVDADLANNAGGWQWVAGCGTDAAPYFRIFNPVTQAERFDSRGAYVRKWVPELARLPDRYLHRPWDAPALELAAAGIRLGETYPEPIIGHVEARARALAAFAAIKGT